MLTEEEKLSFLEKENQNVPEEYKQKKFEEFFVLKNVSKWVENAGEKFDNVNNRDEYVTEWTVYEQL